MKVSNFRLLTTALAGMLIFASASFGQGTRSNNSTTTPDVARAQDQINGVLATAGMSFKEGLLAFEDKNMHGAGEKFDKAVEAFLISTLNIQREARLQNCFNQLIETVYRIEFPADGQLPQVKNLALTCGWSIDPVLADNVTTIAKAQTGKSVAPLSGSVAGIPGATAPIETAFGFQSQAFEPSPRDELAQLELTPDEQQVDTNPVAQQQYQYIQYAVANKSLGFAFQVHPKIQQFINYYRGRGRTTMEVGLYRSGMFMRMARRIFKEEGIPENVAWLGQVESAWKPSALSWAAASGLWQFIPGTGARYGLRRTAYVDERNSFDEATRASARYLKFLYNRYGNWELAIAGYNCGEGNVDKAIRRSGVANFWAAYPYLPKETRDYVPNILATILIANNPNTYGFGHIRPAPSLSYARVRVPGSTNLSLLAQASDTSVQYLRYLNPHLRSNVTPPEPYVVNVPAGKENEVVAVFKRLPASKVSNTNLAAAAPTETWQTISNRTGVTVAELMAANPGMKVPRGKVFFPVRGNGVQATGSSQPVNAPPPAENVRIVKAKAGDTIKKVAEREHADPSEVAQINGLLMNSVLPSGKDVKIPSK